MPRKPPGWIEEKQQLLAEYEALPRYHSGLRSQWLEERGLYKSWPKAIRNAIKSAQARERREQRAVVKYQPRGQAASPQVVPAQLQQPVNGNVTLEDAIRALELRRDIGNEFIAILQNLSKGGR